MKCMKINGVPKLLSFLSKFASCFSFSHYYQKLLVLFPTFTYPTNPSFILVMFLAFSFLIVAIFKGNSSKPSSDDYDQHNSISFLSILESYPFSYIVDEEILDETCSFADIINKDDQEVTPSVIHLELEHDEFISSVVHLESIDGEGATEIHDQEFIPRIVHLELTEGATGSHEDCKDIVPSFVQVGVIESDQEIKELDGYEGDRDDIESIEEDGDDDLNIRIEEFIAKNIRKWKEDMYNDKFLCLIGVLVISFCGFSVFYF